MHFFCSLPHLAIIDLSDTRVTPEGLSLLLACHPKLAKIVHAENFHCFQLVKASFNGRQQWNLKHLSTHDIHITPEDYNYAIEHCPHLESVSITSTGLINEHLYKLMTVKHLSSLHLGNKHAHNFNFYEGLAPVLDAVGANLKKLVLEDFTEVDIDFIGEKCPQLQHLALSNILSYAPAGQPNPKYFTQLSSLEIWNKIGHDHELAVPASVLMQLLGRAPLTYLLLQRIANLTDELFMEVLSLNRLLQLRNVVLDYCHNITGRFIWLLLEQPNKLSVLRCWHNKGVEEDVKFQVKEVVKDDNLMLYWEWYPYNEYEELLDAGQITLEDYGHGDGEEDSDEEDEVVDN